MADPGTPRRPDLVIRPDDGPESRSAVGGPAEFLLHADLHNHTLLSDGDGRPDDAFASMRRAGLDVAAITDHAFGACDPGNSIDEADWRLLGTLADDADEHGRFVAIRGFEWSSPSLGHMNVWGSQGWVDPLPLVADGVGADLAVTDVGTRAVTAFHDWLAGHPAATTSQGELPLVGFNHPGREPDRFGTFHFDLRLVRNLVAFEMFNRDDDYLFEGVDAGRTSPLVECLDAGWRPGLAGVTDEHRARWGFASDLGRTGLWATERSRSGVREALLARRMFATRERGLRADAVADGVPMGGRLVPGGDDIALTVDLDGPSVRDRSLRLQCLSSGRPLPTVVLEFDFTADGGTVDFSVPADRLTGSWLLLRVTDPARPADPRAAPHPAYAPAGRTVVYLSPFYLDRSDSPRAGAVRKA